MIQFPAWTSTDCLRSFLLHLRLTTSTNASVVVAALLFQSLVLQSPLALSASAESVQRPNIVLVMTDDQGWGQTGYYNHPVLKTPNLDAMAASGLRFDRFYAGAPVCSPTRACVLTGRANDRTGVLSHGYALRRQEITLPQILRQHGYTTGHFGKWHLNGYRGPGAPILHSDDHNPGEFGFDDWLSVTNFFDRDPIMSRKGKFEEFQGDSSEIVVSEASKFITRQARSGKPFLAVLWFGSPHDPFLAADDDRGEFSELDPPSQHHYGELVAMDRSVGTLRKNLRELGIQKETLVWFCSDNGGLPKIKPDTVGGLRGNKGTVYEGGLRVPGIIEWEGRIDPRISRYPASVLDILPTVLELTQTPYPYPQRPLDGLSLVTVFDQEPARREKPIPFRQGGKAAWVDNRYKLLTTKMDSGKYELYDLESDPNETKDLFSDRSDLAGDMVHAFTQWSEGVDASVSGRDYPSGKVDAGEPEPRFWTQTEEYQPYLEQWADRWEYKSRLKPKANPKKSAKGAAAK
ncbi:sulfatase family protein [Stieleria varia]|uniref:Arylsulfatase n=1 Tax=Stieleria varia TaxID=2528005 RepID=A0A5C6B322_9BACT|nr:sulfatase-like hydrolase/transferase [Stieleria varia]TWU05646.1 Arylsulfatase precursor [Stieleria varia]